MQNDDGLLREVFKRIGKFISNTTNSNPMIDIKLFEEVRKCLQMLKTNNKQSDDNDGLKFVKLMIMSSSIIATHREGENNSINDYWENDGRKEVIRNLLMEFVKNCCRIELKSRIENTFRKLNNWENIHVETNLEKVGKLMMDRLSSQLIYNSAKFQSLNFLLDDSNYLFSIFVYFQNLIEIDASVNMIPRDLKRILQILEQYCEKFHNTELINLLYKLRKIAEGQELFDYSHIAILEIAKMESEWKEMSGRKTLPQRKMEILSSLFSNVNSNYSDESFVELFQTFEKVYRKVYKNEMKGQSTKVNENLKKGILTFNFIHKMSQHSIPFIENQAHSEPNLSKAEVKIESFDDQDEEIKNVDFMTNLRDTTLQVLSNIESSIGMSFLNYEKISPSMAAHFQNKFLSQVNETLKYEKVNPILEKNLPSIREKTVKDIQDSFHIDPTLSFVFGTPSTDKNGKLITANSRKNLTLKRDEKDTFLELLDGVHVMDDYDAIENDSSIVEMSKDLLDSWRKAEFKPYKVNRIPEIQVKDALFTSSLLMEPLDIEIVISPTFEQGNPILAIIQAQCQSRHESFTLKLKEEFKRNNLAWMGTYHLQCLCNCFGHDLIDVSNVNDRRTLGLSVNLDDITHIANSFLRVSGKHHILCKQVFEENNSSSLWRDFYLDNYQILNPMKDFSESLQENTSQYAASLGILQESQGGYLTDTDNYSIEDWISMMKLIGNRLNFNKNLFLNFIDELDMTSVRNNILDLPSIIMKFYYSIHQVMSELVENLKNQPVSELFIVLLLLSSIGNKAYSSVDISFSNALKSRYFHSKVVELALQQIHQQDEECKFQSVAKDIQILALLNVCLIGFRDHLFLSKIKNNRSIAMEIISNTQLVTRSYTESPILNICKIRIGNNYNMPLDRTTRRFIVYNYLKIMTDKSKLSKSIRDKLLYENMFTENRSIQSKIVERKTLKSVNLRQTKDQQAVKNAYKFLDDQVKEIMYELKPKPQANHQLILNGERDDFEDILDSLSSVCELIIVPSEDAEILTRSPARVKKILLESLPSFLFDMVHTFPDAINQWISFIAQQTMSFLKTLECCQIISHKFKIHGERSVQFTSTKVHYVEISMFLAMQCSNALFQAIKKHVEPFSKILFEMCLLVENFLISENRNSQNIQSLKIKLEKYAIKIQELLKPDPSHLILSIRNQVGQEEFNGIINHLQVENEEGLSQLLDNEMTSFMKHIIQERLLDYHLCMNQFYGEYLENMIPLSESIEFLNNSQNTIPNHHDWKEQFFLSLDFEEYAEILQQVLDGCPKNEEENAESSTLILLQQLILVLGNYPFHKLLNSTENDSIPYLHPIIHSSVISKIASDPLIQQEMANMKPSLKLMLGKLFDNLIRKCCQAKMEFNKNYIKSVKHELIKSLHESHNLAENYHASNMLMSEKLHNFLIKNHSKSGDE